MTPAPARGDVWLVDFDPVRGHEQGKKPRPAIIVSGAILNEGPYGMVIVVPLTRTRTGFPFHVPVRRQIGDQLVQSFVMCEQVRAVSTERLIRFLGDKADERVMALIGVRLRPLLELDGM